MVVPHLVVAEEAAEMILRRETAPTQVAALFMAEGVVAGLQTAPLLALAAHPLLEAPVARVPFWPIAAQQEQFRVAEVAVAKLAATLALARLVR